MFPTSYTYVTREDGYATGQVQSYTVDKKTYSYTYDNNGNILSVSEDGTVIAEYTYDGLNQLISETRDGKVYTYSYDASGNIQNVKENGTVIKTYGYSDTNWSDKLTSFNGNAITYDTIGNPLTYHDGKAFTWQNGRQLSSITDGENVYSYGYDRNGIRISKTVNGAKTEYVWSDGKLIEERLPDGSLLGFHYDATDTAIGFDYFDYTANTFSFYYYLRNLQGDIVSLVDRSGNTIVEYEYDAWGNLLGITGTHADTIGQLNPLRYRGYYYDAETGFYYLSSRYYDPEIGRFLNADKAIAGVGGDIRGYNLYSYCFNNPVNMSDPSGDWPKWVSNIGSAVKDVVNSVVKAVKKAANTVKATVAKFANKTSNASNKRPPTGEPGSTYVAPNGDSRTYGPDGKPVHDYDHSDHGNPKNHPHDENGGHHHDWDWTKNPPRQGPYIPSIEQIIGVGLITISSVGIAAVALDDFTGIGIADNFLYGPLGAGVSQGLIMIY